MILEENIIVAFDTNDINRSKELLTQMRGFNIWIKIGMELFYSPDGANFIFQVKEHGFKIFLDLKMHDIPNTVGNALKSILKYPIDMTNVHAMGGSEMMKRAKEAVTSVNSQVKLIAVTQLTSTSEIQMNTQQGTPGKLIDNVIKLSELAKDCGCDGVVSSAWEVERIKKRCGKDFLTVTPGIRPCSNENQDQIRVTTPEEAMSLGTDYLVIGRPITNAPSPREALENILKRK